MKKYSRIRVGAVLLVGAGVVGGLQACPPTVYSTKEIATVRQFRRLAVEGDTVTVDVTILPGALADTNMTGPPMRFARFSNEGEHAHHERRYGWKPRDQADYDLVLSNDGSGKTKWTMNEFDVKTRAVTARQSGHLWVCDIYSHHPSWRDAGFQDCSRLGIPYDTASRFSPLRVRMTSLLSYLTGGDRAMSVEDAAVWISCTSGCCTLGT